MARWARRLPGAEIRQEATMAITFRDMSAKKDSRKNRDGSAIPYLHICITLVNDGPAAEEQEVTFYRVQIPKGGAMPSRRAPTTLLCTAVPKSVPPKHTITRGGSSIQTDGFEEFCCDFDEDDFE